MACTSVSAQEPEKKKETKSTNTNSGTQERAINETGISVKSKPQSKSAAKTSQSEAVEDKKVEEDKKETKKPD